MNRAPKILHIIDSLGLGGAQTVVKGIFEYQPENMNIFLFALRKRKILTEIKHPNVKVFNSTKKYSLLPIIELRDLIKKENINILHCHLFRSNIFGVFLKLIWFNKIKLIIHEHGGIVEDGFLYRLFLKFSQRLVNFYIAVSKFINLSLVRAGVPQNKVFVVYNFVDTKKFNQNMIVGNIQNEREKFGIPSNSFVVGFAGRLVERKGWREFLQAASVQSKQNNYFLIAGDGIEKEKMLQEIKDLKLESKVKYIGRVSDMVWFYSLVDCFVLPSHWEGLPMTQLEVASMNLPLISAKTPGCDEIFIDNDSCLYFDVNDILDLDKKISLIKNDKNFKNILIHNANAVVQKFNLKNYLINLNKIYE